MSNWGDSRVVGSGRWAAAGAAPISNTESGEWADQTIAGGHILQQTGHLHPGGRMSIAHSRRTWTSFVRRGLEQAEILGDDAAGAEHLLAAVLRPRRPTSATRAMAELGVTHEPLTEWLERRAKQAVPESIGRLLPTAYLVLGRAEGLALASGAERLEDHHVLLSIVYDPSLASTEMVWWPDICPDDVVDALQAQGVQVPPLRPPQHRPASDADRVYYPAEHQQTVLRAMAAASAGGIARWSWCFSIWRPEDRWLNAEPPLDAASIIREALPDSEIQVLTVAQAQEREAEAALEKHGRPDQKA